MPYVVIENEIGEKKEKEEENAHRVNILCERVCMCESLEMRVYLELLHTCKRHFQINQIHQIAVQCVMYLLMVFRAFHSIHFQRKSFRFCKKKTFIID